jgi:hypothetical protein
MIDRFQELMRELGLEYGTQLHLDPLGACKLQIGERLFVQLECDTYQENLLAATFICNIPPGKFRENILKDALKANGPFPKDGTLAYSDRSNELVLFSYLRLASLNGKKLAEFLSAFLNKADNWRVGIETGHTSHLASLSPKPSTSIFDLKH